MSNLIELVQGQLTEGFISQLAQKTGTSPEATEIAANGAISSLIGALSKNAQDPQQAQALNQALDQDHDGSILNNLSGILLGNKQAQNPATVNGAGIVNHVLGGKSGSVIDMISNMSGMGSSSAGSILTTLAPLVMGVLGQQKSNDNLGTSGLSSLLTNSVQETQQQNSNFGKIMNFLDSDGSGSAMDEIMDIGSSLLGSFFKR